jgi:hypothetical protein
LAPTGGGSGENRRRQDPLEEALRLIESASSAGLQVRLLGGLAFHAKLPCWTAQVDRAGRDIDLATRSRDKRAVANLLTGEGYVPDKGYNAVHGYKQLYFADPENGRPVDVLIDRLEMCHLFHFRDRLAADYPTLPLAELLLSKLQIVKLNKKDIVDVLVLLSEYPLTENDTEGINMRVVTEVCATDWGWWRTLTKNVEIIANYGTTELAQADVDVGRPARNDPVAQLRQIQKLVDSTPKSLKWRLRAQVGDRVTWYKEPEETGHAVL